MAVFGCVYTCHCQGMSGWGLLGLDVPDLVPHWGRALGEGCRLGVRVSSDLTQPGQELNLKDEAWGLPGPSAGATVHQLHSYHTGSTRLL